ncbi:DEAD/DEAH box helicase [Candidatus Micrarchaeota archaeon]|nr:DEAD/DEAH box helicase [Candidatus Micrarchaeota archaeon]
MMNKLNTKTTQSLKKMGFENLTEVQKKVIPFILEGKEVICRSKTGTGKTAAFGIGLIERLVEEKSKKGLIITPTRELAVQVSKELHQIGKIHRIEVLTIYGGVSIDNQISNLRHNPEIVVATPGRLLDLIQRGNINPKKFDMVILDEADIMLDMGFIDDIDKVLQMIQPPPLIALFSATVDEQILNIAKKYMRNYEFIEISDMSKPIEISEKIIDVTKNEKFGALLDILFEDKNRKTLIFLNTKRGVERVAEKIEQKRFKVGTLHGNMSQNKREFVLQQFKENKINILIATDVAARGIHINNVDLVINFDLAKTAKTHLHRIGRTGRMNQKGNAISFNTVNELRSEYIGYLPPVESESYTYKERGENKQKRKGRKQERNKGNYNPQYGDPNYSY